MSQENIVNNAIKYFQEEQDFIKSSEVRPTDAVSPETITETKIYQDENTNKWVKEDKEIEGPKDDRQLADVEKKLIDAPANLQQACAIIDNKIIAINAQINGLKAQVASLSAEATAGNCWPGIACSAWFFDDTQCNPLNITIDYSTKTTVKQDRELISIYPKLAGPQVDYTVGNPFQGETTSELTSSYAGYGYLNTKSDDSGTTVTTTARYDLSASTSDHQNRIVFTIGAIKYRYLGAGVAPYATDLTMTPARCVEIKNQIDSLNTQITTLRAQRDSQNRTDLNIIKDKKTGDEVRAWGIIKNRNTVETLKTDNQAAITALGKLL